MITFCHFEFSFPSYFLIINEILPIFNTTKTNNKKNKYTYNFSDFMNEPRLHILQVDRIISVDMLTRMRLISDEFVVQHFLCGLRMWPMVMYMSILHHMQHKLNEVSTLVCWLVIHIESKTSMQLYYT